jgi:TATA-binding protein-associated factor Taf7
MTRRTGEQLFLAGVQPVQTKLRPRFPSKLGSAINEPVGAIGSFECEQTLELIQAASQVMDDCQAHASAIEGLTERILTEASAKLEQALTQTHKSVQLAEVATARAEAAEKRAEAAETDLKLVQQQARDAQARAEHAEQQAREATQRLASLETSITEAFLPRISRAGQEQTGYVSPWQMQRNVAA